MEKEQKRSGRGSGLIPAGPGNNRNPLGAGAARTRVTAKFLIDLADYYDVNGPQIIHEVRVKDPVALLNVVAKLLPKEAHLSIDASVSVDLTKEQRARIAEAWMLGQSDQLEALEGEAVRIIDESRERVDFKRLGNDSAADILSESPSNNKSDGSEDIKQGSLLDFDAPPERVKEVVPKLRRGQRAVISRCKGFSE